MAYKTSEETKTRKAERKRQIINSAAEIFADKGYSGTTVKEIVAQSGTSIGNFYFYFKNKDDLIEILYDEFHDMLNRVSDFALSGKHNIVKGFCRSKTSELWAFQNCKGLAKALMIEATGFNPKFEHKRAEIIKDSNSRIEQLFNWLKKQGILDIIDPKVAAILCNGTMYAVITDWLQNDSSEKLTNYAFQIITFNLNAFKLDYNISLVEEYINKMIGEMEKNFKLQI